MVKTAFAITTFVLMTLATALRADAAEIKVLAARALATVLYEIGPQFERMTGHRLIVSEFIFNEEFVRKIDADEPFDVLIARPPTIDPLIKQGKIVADTRIDVARAGIGVEVRVGAPKPDIASVEAFKRALLDAKSIAYLRVGSGEYIAVLVERLGIADALSSKTIRPTTDIVSQLVAKGEVALGIVITTQIMTTPGVELVGPLPPELQSYVVLTAGISANSKAPDAARDLVKFLTGPIALPVIKSQGMEPG
jgi:molybdate transport system substrate-binding protein